MQWYYHNAGFWNVTDRNLKNGTVIQVAKAKLRFGNRTGMLYTVVFVDGSWRLIEMCIHILVYVRAGACVLPGIGSKTM